MSDTLISTVATVNAGSPNPEIPCHSLQRLIRYVDGMESFVSVGQNVLLLVNLRFLESITYLCLVSGIAAMVRDAGGTVMIGDSPWLTDESPSRYWRASGLSNLASCRHWTLVDFEAEPMITVALRSHAYYVPEIVLRADVIINVAPVMRHRRCRLAGGLFNIFGVLPGFKAAQLPRGYTSTGVFCEVAADLLSVVAPALTVLDASPVSRHTHVVADCRRRLLISTDTVAADAVAAHSLGLQPDEVPAVRIASEAGLGIGWLDGIEQVGDSLYPLRLDNLQRFQADRSLRLPEIADGLAESMLWCRPRVDSSKCQRCHHCVDLCPTGALDVEPGTGHVRHNASLCVACYRCRESCPEEAVSIQRSWLLNRLGGPDRGWGAGSASS
ncbi:DUF362 domain-containing protein [candidate division GN15 bacterium]|nr:DUF362 domain-containing protein [candidate division GN15 bacterium]